MIIYVVGLLAACMLIGVYAGDLIGALLGIDANIGGVGIAMLILILVSNHRPVNVSIKPITAEGITFWNAMYIPIVIAMTATFYTGVGCLIVPSVLFFIVATVF